jgi:hypothetical protein
MLRRLVECGALSSGDLVSLNQLAAKARAHQRLESRDNRLTWTWAPSATPLDRALARSSSTPLICWPRRDAHKFDAAGTSIAAG